MYQTGPKLPEKDEKKRKKKRGKESEETKEWPRKKEEKEKEWPRKKEEKEKERERLCPVSFVLSHFSMKSPFTKKKKRIKIFRSFFYLFIYLFIFLRIKIFRSLSLKLTVFGPLQLFRH